MPSRDSITKTIRLNACDLAVLDEIMTQYGLSWSGAIHFLISERGTPQKEEKTKRGTPQNKGEENPNSSNHAVSDGVHPSLEHGVHPFISESSLADIENMCGLCGISTQRFFDEVCRLFNEGKIEVEGLNLKSVGEYDLSELETVCHLNNVSVEDALDKTITSMARFRR